MQAKTRKLIILISFLVVIMVFAVIFFRLNFAILEPRQTPQLSVTLTIDGLPNQHIQALQLSNKWTVVDVRGRYRGGYVASAELTLDFWAFTPWDFSEVIFYLDCTNGRMELYFSDDFPPDSVYFRRWNAELIGSSVDLWPLNPFVEIENNTIIVSDSANDYIYEVRAVWSQGESIYTFRINGFR